MPVPNPARPPRAPSRGIQAYAWDVFSLSFRRAYHVRCPFDGEGRSWPRGTSWWHSSTNLPAAVTNREALERIAELAQDRTDVRARIERMFRSPVQRREGICLERIAAWWPWLATDEALAVRTRLLGRKS